MKFFLLICLFSTGFTFANVNDLNLSITNNANQMISNERVESELKILLSNIKNYKEKNKKKIKNLELKLALMEKKFKHYKIKKNREIKSINKKLALTKKKLTDKEQKVCEEKENSIVTIIPTVPKTEESKRTEWIEVVVENDINIYDLALKYYGDAHQYEQIYIANQNLIDNSFKIHNGMSLKIPITDTFQEQPMFLNQN